MAVYQLDPETVIAAATATLEVGTAGATIQTGQCLYVDANGKMQKCETSSGDAAIEARVVGVAANQAYLDQPVVYITGGIVNLEPLIKNGGLFGIDGEYIWCETAGRMSDSTPSVGDWMSWIGYTLDADRLFVLPAYSDTQYS